MFSACTDDGRPLAARDAAVLGVLYGAGVRRAEAAALDLSDFDREAGALRVVGKGNKERLAYVRHGARDALDDWLALRGDAPGPLFWPVTKGGKLRPRRLSAQAMLYVTRRRGQRAGVERFSPHDLRRSFISDLLDAGADLSTVRQLAGTPRFRRRPATTVAVSRPSSRRPTCFTSPTRRGGKPEPRTAGARTQLTGAVDRITFFNPQTGFSVVRLRVRGRREPVAVVGLLPAVQPGERLVLSGHWQTDPRHGAQFRPEQATVEPPTDGEDIVRYLGSGLIRQIGPVLAKRIVAAFGSDTLAVLDAEPERVQQVAGVGQQRARSIVESWRTHQALRGVSSFLSEHGLDTRFAPRLLATYGDQAPAILRANPYRLVGEVPGLGFRAADRLGSGLGVRPSAPPRLQAAIHAALLRAAEQGHTRQQADQLLAAGCGLTGQDREVLEPALRQLEEAGVIGTRQRRPAEPDAGGLFDVLPRRSSRVRSAAGSGSMSLLRVSRPRQPRRRPASGSGWRVW